jgi:phosphatidate cytidylyltransferase
LIPPGFGGNLARRVATALVVLPVVLAALFLGPPWLVVMLAGVVLAQGLREFYSLVEARSLRPMKLTGLLLAAAIFLEETHPGWSGAPIWPALAVWLFLAALRRADDPGQTVPSAAATLLGATYLGGLGGALAGLRLLEPQPEGIWRVALLLTIVIFADTTAYFVGHAVGRHLLAPRFSPRKTVEGALGALVGGVIGALAARWAGLPELSATAAVALGAVVAAMCVVGDLFESLLKRWAGVKDSGGIFPGHGGVLDRLDGLLFGAPVLYYYFFYLR